MHFVEVRRWMDVKKHGSVNDDPIFKGNRVPNPEPGYPGGPFDPLGFAKGDFKSLQTKVRERERERKEKREQGGRVGLRAPLSLLSNLASLFPTRSHAPHSLFFSSSQEIKNGRLAMVAFMGFIIAGQATGKGPLAALGDHLASPFASNWTKNIGVCHIPKSVDVEGITIPLTCLWPGQQM